MVILRYEGRKKIFLGNFLRGRDRKNLLWATFSRETWEVGKVCLDNFSRKCRKKIHFVQKKFFLRHNFPKWKEKEIFFRQFFEKKRQEKFSQGNYFKRKIRKSTFLGKNVKKKIYFERFFERKREKNYLSSDSWSENEDNQISRGGKFLGLFFKGKWKREFFLKKLSRQRKTFLCNFPRKKNERQFFIKAIFLEKRENYFFRAIFREKKTEKSFSRQLFQTKNKVQKFFVCNFPRRYEKMN